MEHPTRLSRADYLGAWNTDLDRIASVVHNNGHLRVPTCPEWTVLELVEHLAGVYQHKIWVLELGKMPPPSWSDEALVERRKNDPVVELRHWAQALQTELLARNDSDEASTFMRSDRTVGFWWRRMALETAVHRTDAELASGQRTDVSPELARDGIDELLWFATAPWQQGSKQGWSHQRVVVDAGDLAWTAVLDPEGMVTSVGDDGSSTRVSGSPDSLLQWSAGRRVEDVERSGDQEAIALLERFLGNF